MLYRYCKESLSYSKVPFKKYVGILLVILSLNAISNLYFYSEGLNKKMEELSNVEKILLIEEKDSFTEDKLIEMMADLNVKFPWIPLAQSMVETGHFNSDIFLENHNLFGMKQARRRVTTAEGTNRGHAYYSTWRESVYDYAFYQSRYLGKIETEEQYYQYIDASYAEDTSYVNKLKQVIHKYKLKEKFTQKPG